MWNRRRGPVPGQREQKGSTFFLTGNYAEAGIERLHEDLHKIHEHAELMCGEGGHMQMACFWEERGKDTGNPHYHGIIVFRREARTRCAAVANALEERLGIQVRPHIEPLRDLAAAVRYRDKPEKAEAWQKWVHDGSLPAFFVLIH